jgi:hypothetical protein
LFNAGAILKSLKGGVKSAAKNLSAAAKATAKKAVSNVGMLGKAAVETAGAIVKNGKIAMKGIGKGFGKGVKSLGDLMKKLGSHLKFRKFRIVLTRGWFSLEGYLNPWVAIIKGPLKGTLKEIDDVDDFLKGATRKGRETLGAVGKVSDEAGHTFDVVLVSMTKGKPKDYRGIMEAFLKATEPGNASIADEVIHHVIEKQTSKMLQAFEAEFINAPKNFYRVAKGIFNNVIHLSHIRRMWSALYPWLRPPNQYSKEAIRRALMHYAAYTERFLAAVTKEAKMMSPAALTEDALETIVQQWLKAPGNSQAVAIAEALAEAAKAP